MSAVLYEGVDLANAEHRIGRCAISDDGQHLVVRADDLSETAQKTAIDCPFGTTEGYYALLSGRLPKSLSMDGYKTRESERWLRGEVDGYDIVNRWRTRTRNERQLYPKTALFIGAGHVQPSLGMQIVPECLWHIVTRLPQPLDNLGRDAELAKSRRGEGSWIEAHPRMFLYSIIERIYRRSTASCGLDVLFAAARYKGSQQHRSALYRLITQNPSWMGDHVRQLSPVDPPFEIVENDHKFDAFLTALTAWAHSNGECVTWQQAGVNREVVDIEGHILVLSQR